MRESVKIYNSEDVLVFEKVVAKTGNRLFVEIPAALRHKVRRNVKYIVVLIPSKRIVEREFP